VLGTIGTNSSGAAFSLAGGTAQVTGLLPVGTVSVEATYGGNVTYAVSTSAPVALPKVAGAGYTAETTVYFVNGSGQTSTSAQNFTYGTPYSLAIVISRSDGTSCAFGYPNTKPNNPTIPCPTGTITLLDNGAALPDFLNNGNPPTNVTRLNSLGIAEDQVINLFATVGGTTPAPHNITATYSGDSNYAAGTVSNTLKITIKQAPTSIQISGPSSVSSGASVVLQALVAPTTPGNGDAPCGSPNTGTVAFTSNGTALSGTVTYVATPGANSPTGASCTASLTTTISALYPPPEGGPRAPWMPVLAAAFSMLLFALGLRWIPETRRRAYTFAGLLVIALLVSVIAGCGGGSSSGGGSARIIGATYSGDANYATSAATPITIQVQ
jgi:hypothetical protein